MRIAVVGKSGQLARSLAYVANGQNELVFFAKEELDVLDDKATHKVKRIVVYGNQRLSLQSHTMRAETWVVVRGEGIVTINDSNISVKTGDCVIIPMNAKKIKSLFFKEALSAIAPKNGAREATVIDAIELARPKYHVLTVTSDAVDQYC